jgi:hypothetical protein
MTSDTLFSHVAPEPLAQDDFFKPPPPGMWLLAFAAVAMVTAGLTTGTIAFVACLAVWACLGTGVWSVVRWVGRYAGVFARNLADGYRASASRHSGQR